MASEPRYIIPLYGKTDSFFENGGDYYESLRGGSWLLKEGTKSISPEVYYWVQTLSKYRSRTQEEDLYVCTYGHSTESFEFLSCPGCGLSRWEMTEHDRIEWSDNHMALSDYLDIVDLYRKTLVQILVDELLIWAKARTLEGWEVV